MIQIIGLMIGVYIFTRMLAMLLDKNAHIVARISAGLTIVADVMLVFSLLLSGVSGAPPIPR